MKVDRLDPVYRTVPAVILHRTALAFKWKDLRPEVPKERSYEALWPRDRKQY